MKYKVNYNQDWDSEGYHTTQNINILCTPEELDILNSKAGEQQLTDGKQMLKLTTLKNLKDTIFADNPRVKDDRNTMVTITLTDTTPLHERKDLKETVLKTLKEVLENGDVNPWLKQNQINQSWENPDMPLDVNSADLDPVGKANIDIKADNRIRTKYNKSLRPDRDHDLPDENLNVRGANDGRLAMASMSDTPHTREFGRTAMPTQTQSVKAMKNYHEQKQRIRNIAKQICEELLMDNGEDTPANNYLEGKTLTLTSRGGTFTAKVSYEDLSYPKGVRLHANIGHTSVIITLSKKAYYDLLKTPHGTATAVFQAKENNLPPTDCTLRVD